MPQDLALPIDIPWKRLAASADMVDRSYGDRRFPPRWRSSISVFYHEPDDLPAEYCDRTVTYLKLVCSITGYQAGAEVTATPIPDDAWHTEHRRLGDEYHACYGALVQVAVFPRGPKATVDTSLPLSDYPYISDFEPKRRELYEAVTESGEILGRSSSTLNVRKGATSAASTEYASKVGAEVKGSYGGSVEGKVYGEHSWGGGTHLEEQTLRTTDDSREKRETYSSSTSLTQMYELFSGYHLGGNRAVFSMVARPHTTEAKDQYTFVNGPRRLEGLQEIFLIVNRPKHVPGICVEAYLETAHLVAEIAEPDRAPTPTPTIYEDREATVGMSGRWENPSGEPGQTKDFQQALLTLPEGCELDSSRGGQSFDVDDINDAAVKYRVTVPGGFYFDFQEGTFWRSIKSITGGVSGNQVSATVTLKGLGGHGPFATRGPERFNANVHVYYRCAKQSTTEPTQTVSGERKTLFLTSRGVSACSVQAGAQETSHPGAIDFNVDYEKVFAARNDEGLMEWLERHRVVDFDEDPSLSSDRYRAKLDALRRQDDVAFRAVVHDAVDGAAGDPPPEWCRPAEWVTFESTIPAEPTLDDPQAPASARLRAANELSGRVVDAMSASLRGSGRYAQGDVDFWRSRIVIARLAETFRHLEPDDPENLPIAGLDLPYADRAMAVFGEAVRRRDLAIMPTQQLARSLGVSEVDARTIRGRLLNPELRPNAAQLERVAAETLDEATRDRMLERWLPHRGPGAEATKGRSTRADTARRRRGPRV